MSFIFLHRSGDTDLPLAFVRGSSSVTFFVIVPFSLEAMGEWIEEWKEEMREGRRARVG
jgi:uncharacterized beta-barrel protein YwiB (DUF1934 family)